jgi:hypothetical protein
MLDDSFHKALRPSKLVKTDPEIGTSSPELRIVIKKLTEGRR